MLSPRLANRYAKSLYDLAAEKQETASVIKDMHLLNDTISESKDLRLLLKSPIIPASKKEGVLNAIFSNKLSEITSKFIKLLVGKGREKVLDEVVTSFISLYNSKNAIVEATLITATAVGNETVEKVKNLLLSNKDVKEVSISNKVDASIIGGFVLQYGDLLFDNSVERKLQLIKKQIQDESYISKK